MSEVKSHKAFALENSKIFDSPFKMAELMHCPVPSRKTEDWKYNDVFFLQNDSFSLLSAEPLTSKINFDEIKLDIQQQCENKLGFNILKESNVFIFINGVFVKDLSNIVDDENLSITLGKDFDDQQIKKSDGINQQYGHEKNPVVALVNGSEQFQSLIEISKINKLNNPVYVLHYAHPSAVSSQNDSSGFAANKILVDIAKNMECEIIETFLSASDSNTQLSAQATLVNVGDNSQCHHYRLNLEADTHKQISNCSHLLNKDSYLNSFFYSSGSLLNKTDVKIINLGSGANSQTTGIYLPFKQRNIDYHTCIEHRVPHCNSKEVFRGIIADKAKATFNGKIHIYKDAQKSDAQLSNKNLLLTNTAEINTKPELEIYADDVVCAHGATVAKIDESSIFYLKSRGISDSKARAMVSIGFINELLSNVNNENIKNSLFQLVQNRLSRL